MTYSSATAAWCAGFFDGEGCVYTIKGHGRTTRNIKVSIANTNRQSLERFKNLFGGSLCLRKKATGNQKPCYQWCTSVGKAEQFLRTILPFSVVKAPQIKLALKIREVILANKRSHDSEGRFRKDKRKDAQVLRLAKQIQVCNGWNWRKARKDAVALSHST